LKKNKFNSLYPTVLVESAEEYFDEWLLLKTKEIVKQMK